MQLETEGLGHITELVAVGDLTLASSLTLVRKLERELGGKACCALIDMTGCGRRLTKGETLMLFTLLGPPPPELPSIAFVDTSTAADHRERAALASGRYWPTFSNTGAAQWWLDMHCRHRSGSENGSRLASR